MTLPPLLRPSYWFDVNPLPFLPIVDRALLALFSIMLFAGILARLISMRQGWEKMTRRAIRRASTMLMVLGAVGLLLYFFTYERLTFLSMRFWYLLWVALLVWYVYRLVKFVRTDIPMMEQRRVERDAINKWLPKSK